MLKLAELCMASDVNDFEVNFALNFFTVCVTAGK